MHTIGTNGKIYINGKEFMTCEVLNADSDRSTKPLSTIIEENRSIPKEMRRYILEFELINEYFERRKFYE